MRTHKVSLKVAKAICCFILLALPTLALAQDTAPAIGQDPSNLKTLLHDAAYVFNRYEDLTAEVNPQIDDWKVPASLKENARRALAAVSKNESEEKPQLYKLLNESTVSSTALFDVYSELVDCAAELQDLSESATLFGNDQNTPMELAQMGDRASLVSTKLGIILRMQIMTQEAELANCRASQISKPKQRHSVLSRRQN